ncbi:MAG: class I SAM-dependent rRNA methyltransferase [Planctomycetota bacterium]
MSQATNNDLPIVRLKSPRRFLHPWIFQRLVEKPQGRVSNGSLVKVVDPDGRFMGRGIFNWHSRIAIRVLSNNEDEPLDDAFFTKRVNAAVSLRRDMLRLDATTNAYRVINSEADGLSGLIVDRFNDLLVMEFFSSGMYRLKDRLIPLLLAQFPDSRIYWFAEEHVQKQESFDCHPPAVTGPCVVTENGLRFRVQPGFKHKTGFFADQRDNRLRLAQYCEGKRVLDICCNTGGFAVYAAALGKAREVVGLDLDETALELARQNAGLNQTRPRWVQADLFPWLRDAITQKNLFDVVILDPAKQTRDRDEVDMALRRYFDMNRLALQVVREGGILVTCSCTGLVGEPDFLECVRRAARAAGRVTQVLAIHGAGSDHPYQLQVPEGRYLKVVFLRVLEAGEPLAAPEHRREEPEQ